AVSTRRRIHPRTATPGFQVAALMARAPHPAGGHPPSPAAAQAARQLATRLDPARWRQVWTGLLQSAVYAAVVGLATFCGLLLVARFLMPDLSAGRQALAAAVAAVAV